MASGDRVEKRLIGPVALTASNAGIGSAVGSGKTWVIKQIIFCNTDGSDRLVYLAIGSSATPSYRFASGMPIAANDTVVLDTAMVLEATEQLYGYADTGSVVTVIALGWEKTN